MLSNLRGVWPGLRTHAHARSVTMCGIPHNFDAGARAASSTAGTFMALAMLPLIFNLRKMNACMR